MNNKMIALIVPLCFFACESDEGNPDETLVGGTWVVNSVMGYPESQTCEGTGIEVLTEGYGLSFAFTDMGDVTTTNTFNISSDSLCAGWEGVLINDGVDCFDEAMLNGDGTAADTAYATISMDTLCAGWEGEYSNNFCSGSDSEVSEYSVDGDMLSLTLYAGTDSSEVQSGTLSIDANKLTINLVEIDVSDDGDYSICYKYSAEK